MIKKKVRNELPCGKHCSQRKKESIQFTRARQNKKMEESLNGLCNCWLRLLEIAGRSRQMAGAMTSSGAALAGQIKKTKYSNVTGRNLSSYCI
jgi:hypothetical protein